MKKLVLFLVISLLVFGSLSMAKEPDERIEKSITKLEQVQDLLEEGDQEEAASILTEVNSEITQSRFQLLTNESNRTLVGSKWVIKFTEKLKLEKAKYRDYSDEYYIEIGYATVENQANEERGASFDVYVLDPKGFQWRLSLLPDYYVLPGASKYFTWYGTIEKSKFIPGTYTLFVKPNFESEPESLRLMIELSEEDFGE